MKNLRHIHPFLGLAIIGLFLFLGACSKAYVSSQFEGAMQRNPSIAVLPYQIIFQGNPPKKLTAEDMEKIDARERIAFQKSFFRWLGSRWRERTVRLQSTTVTNSRLEKAGIDLSRIDEYPPDELARLLGVDHVFSCVVVKHRYRSDLASLGLDAANILLQGEGVFINSKTNDVIITANLIRAGDGATLWSHTREGEVQWDYPLVQVMDNVHQRLMRQLPKK